MSDVMYPRRLLFYLLMMTSLALVNSQQHSGQVKPCTYTFTHSPSLSLSLSVTPRSELYNCVTVSRLVGRLRVLCYTLHALFQGRKSFSVISLPNLNWSWEC